MEVLKQEEQIDELNEDEVEEFFLAAQDGIPEDSSSDSNICDESNNGDETADPDFPVCAYTLLNILVIIWGIIGVLMTMAHETQKEIDEFFQVDKGSLNLPPYFMYASSSLGICTGVTALIFLMAESASFFALFPHLNGLIEGLNIMATLCAVGAWSTPNIHKYQRLLESDTLVRYNNDTLFQRHLGDEYKGFWDKLQTDLQCCGLEGPHNWNFSVCECIPTSCCQSRRMKECKKRILAWNDPTSNYYKNFSRISDYLWPTNCVHEMTREIDKLKRDWISLPIVLLFFHLLLMFNINYIVVSVKSRYNVMAGFKIISDFKEKMKKKICCKCKRNKISIVKSVDQKPVEPNQPKIETNEPEIQVKSTESIAPIDQKKDVKQDSGEIKSKSNPVEVTKVNSI